MMVSSDQHQEVWAPLYSEINMAHPMPHKFDLNHSGKTQY